MSLILIQHLKKFSERLKGFVTQTRNSFISCFNSISFIQWKLRQMNKISQAIITKFNLKNKSKLEKQKSDMFELVLRNCTAWW